MLENICGNCGYPYKGNETSCPNCGQIRMDADNYNSGGGEYGMPILEKPMPGAGYSSIEEIDAMYDKSPKSHITAGVLGIVLGAWGIHKFYLGYTKTGIIMIVITLACVALTCGVLAAVPIVIGVCEGIHYLTLSQEDFDMCYVKNEKHWF